MRDRKEKDLEGRRGKEELLVKHFHTITCIEMSMESLFTKAPEWKQSIPAGVSM